MPFLLTEILNFQGSTHLIGVGSFSKVVLNKELLQDKSGEEIVNYILDDILKIDEELRPYVKAFAYVYYWIGNMLPIPFNCNPFGLGDRGTWRNKVLYLSGFRNVETNLNNWKSWREDLSKSPSWKNDNYFQDMFLKNGVKPFYKSLEGEEQVFFSKKKEFNQKLWFLNNSKLIIQRSYRIINSIQEEFNDLQKKDICDVFEYVFKEISKIEDDNEVICKELY